MNDRERILKRIERDKARRASKKEEFIRPYDDYEAVFDFEKLWDAGKKCCNGVRWKASVQRWEAFLLTNITNIYNGLLSQEFQKHSGKFFCFDLFERGHLRHIRSLKISERTVQKALCDNALVPVLSRSFIYDNGATMKYKGIAFAEERLTKHIRRFVREMTPKGALENGYVLQFDFHHYFDNASHEVLFGIIDRSFKDERLKNTIKKFVSDFGDKGLGLGSQISQALALTLANDLDHEIKDRMGMKFYGRYMDDGYVLCSSKEEAKDVLEALYRVVGKLKIEVNEKKTRITKFRKGFRFLKVLYRTTETGKIIRKTNHEGIKRMRQKLLKFKKKYAAGSIPLENVEMALEAWFAHCMRANTFHTRLNMLKRFRRMFPDSKAFMARKRNKAEEMRKAQAFLKEWKQKHASENPFWSRIHMIHEWKLRKEKEADNGVLQISFRRCCA